MAEYAIENGSTDNVSVAIVLLEKTVSINEQEDELSVVYDKDGGIKHLISIYMVVVCNLKGEQ